MAKGGQKPGSEAESSTPGEFKAGSVAYKSAASAFGKSGTPDNQSTSRGKGKS